MIFVPILDKLKIDDVVGAIPVHLIAGIWGTLAVPLTNTEVPFVAQITGVVATGVFVCITSGIVWFALKATVGVRPSAEEEMGSRRRRDRHGAYPEFAGQSLYYQFGGAPLSLLSSGAPASHVPLRTPTVLGRR